MPGVDIPKRPKRKFKRWLLSEWMGFVKGKIANQLYIDVEETTEGFVIPQEMAGLIANSGGTISNKTDATGSQFTGGWVPEVVTNTATAVDASWSPGANEIYEVLGVHVYINCAAVVANRTPSLAIFHGIEHTLGAMPTSGFWVCPTGPTLSTGQSGGMWFSGRGSNVIWLNDNGVVTATAAGTDNPFPLYISGDTAQLVCQNSNDQAGDVNGIAAIVKRVA